MSRQANVTVSEIRQGDENDGPLVSTDLFIEADGWSLLINVAAGQQFTYALNDHGRKSHGTVGSLPKRKKR